MSTSPNLPAGTFITTLNGRRCTAVPRSDAPAATPGGGRAGGGGGGRGGNSATSPPAEQTQAPAVEEPRTTTPLPPVQAIPSSTPQPLAPEPTSTPVAPVQIPTADVPPPSQTPPSPTLPVVTPPVAPVQITSQTTTPDPIISPASSIASEPAPTTFATSTSPEAPPPIVLSTSNTVEKVAANTDNESATSVIVTPTSTGTGEAISSDPTGGTALSDTQSSPTPSLTSGDDSSFGQQTVPSITSGIAKPSGSSPGSAAEQKTTQSGPSSTTKSNTLPIMGGIFAGLALVGIIGVILWCCKRRRRSSRTTLLTPLGPPPGEKTYYEIDNFSVGPSPRAVRLRAGLGYQAGKVSSAISNIKTGVLGIGASLRSKVTPERSDSPTVNLNRGNSQFLDGPIPQHSRHNSVLSYDPKLTVKDRIENWWDQFQANLAFKRQLRSRSEQDPFADPITNPRDMAEKQAPRNGTPDFSRLLDIDDQLMKVQATRRSASISHSGSLGLNFQSGDLFSDSQFNNTAWTPPSSNANENPNPFIDPIVAPQPSIPKGQSYIADVRRSRGQSIDVPTSRYPSTIAPSRDSYRDTVFSSFTTTTRKGKGRSDPFDLERPDLWKPLEKQPPVPVDSRTSTSAKGGSTIRDPATYSTLYVDPLRMSTVQPRTVGGRQPLSPVSSKYSSGVSSLGGLGDWGEPGPDLGPGSQGSTLRGNESGNSSMQFGANGVYLNGSLAELVLRREHDNVSPLSIESKGKGVGKAM